MSPINLDASGVSYDFDKDRFVDCSGVPLDETDPRVQYLLRPAMERAQELEEGRNMERAITNLCEIREAAAALGDQGHDIACWAEDALKALGYDK